MNDAHYQIVIDFMWLIVMIRCPPELSLRTGNFMNVQEVEEGKEPTEFWNAIGPQDRKSYDCMLQGV